MDIPKYVSRPIYLNKIRKYLEKDIIKVISGQRRVGKSYMLYQIIDEIKNKHTNPDIIYINKEWHEYKEIKDDESLIDYIEKHKSNKELTYLFIDEVQDIENFEKALRSLQSKKNYNIFCTGSNAQLLSGDLATYLSGRYVEIKLYSLIYPEFLHFHHLDDSSSSFIKFLKYGGLPYLINLELENQVVYDYLKNIYSAILFKDVVKRYQIRHVSLLENLVYYLADNTGSIVSAKKITDFLKSQQIKISPQVVSNYLSYLTSAFFIFKVLRSDIKGKKIFEFNEKYYFEDLGLRHAIKGYKTEDINKILENIIYQHLVVSGYQVTIGQLESKEIDFVAEKNGKKIYIQVAYLIPDENTREREFGNLMKVKDNYPKYVISMDEILGGTDYQGIEHWFIRDFLAELR
ncbi:MAG: ATP-binding protein [Bacteroidales bacterium]|nr:ATP-binding protein [Bacteroidales bacterium]